MENERGVTLRSALLFLATFATFALLGRAELTSIDEIFIAKTAEGLAERSTHRILWNSQDPPDRNYSRFSLLPSIWAVPFHWLGGFLERIEPSNSKWLNWAVGLSSAALTAATATLLYRWLLCLRQTSSVALTSALLFALGTLACPYSSSLYIQTFSMFTLLLAVMNVQAQRPLATLVTCLLLIWCRADFVIFWPAFALATWQSKTVHRLQVIASVSIGMIAGWGLTIGTNLLRGDPTFAGAYAGEGFTTPLLLGLLGSLLSFGKGLLWSSPIAAVGLLLTVPYAGRRPIPGRLVLYVCMTLWIVMSKWWTWHGAISFGPRLLLPMLPLCFVPIADLLQRWNQHSTLIRRIVASISVCTLLVGIWSGLVAPPPIDLFATTETESIFVPQSGPFSRIDWPIRSWLLTHRSSLANTLIGAAGVVAVLSLILCLRHARHGMAMFAVFVDRKFLAALAIALLIVGPGCAEWVSSQFGAKKSIWQRRLDSDRPSEFRGNLFAPLRGEYQFFLNSQMQIQLHDGKFARTLFQKSAMEAVNLEEGYHPIVVRPMAEDATLNWTIPGAAYYKQPIPDVYLVASAATTWQHFRILWLHYGWLLWLPAFYFFAMWLSQDGEIEARSLHLKSSGHDDTPDTTQPLMA